MTKGGILAVATLLLIGSLAFAQQEAKPASPHEFKHSLERLRDIVPDTADPFAVSEEAQALIVDVKRGLLAIVTNAIGDSSSSASPEELKSAVQKEWGRRGIGPQVLLKEMVFRFGTLLDVAFVRPQSFPDLLIAQTFLWHTCQADESIYVFRKSAAGWDLVMGVESNFYERISGGQGEIVWALRPHGDQGGFVLAMANHSPWCTSAFRDFRFRILHPSAEAFSPRAFLDESLGVFLGPAYQVVPTEKGFSLTFAQSAGETVPEELYCTKVWNFAIDGSTVSVEKEMVSCE